MQRRGGGIEKIVRDKQSYKERKREMKEDEFGRPGRREGEKRNGDR